MKKTLFLSLLPFVLMAAPGDNLLMTQDEHMRIIVNNRVLANVNGKPMTVIDVMKRMDLVFLKQFPEYTNSPTARHQFYLANWKRTLNELIDKELMLADAKEMKMEVANGDVRQEMESLFGPNIILNLDKIGLSLDEATKIVSGDIAIRRMMYLKVTAKALGKVTPLAIRSRYDEWSKENARPTLVKYRMLTIRDPLKGKEIVQELHETLSKTSPDILTETLTPFKNRVGVSDEFTHSDKEISPQNKEILLSLGAGKVSDPVEQKSRADNSTVWRLFYVIDKQEGGIPSLKESENPIKEMLLDAAINEEQKSYLNRLRRHYGVRDAQIKEMIPEDFIPFSLK